MTADVGDVGVIVIFKNSWRPWQILTPQMKTVGIHQGLSLAITGSRQGPACGGSRCSPAPPDGRPGARAAVRPKPCCRRTCWPALNRRPQSTCPILCLLLFSQDSPSANSLPASADSGTLTPLPSTFQRPVISTSAHPPCQAAPSLGPAPLLPL